MACEIDNGRFTSKDLVVEYLPCGEEQVHVQQLRFHEDVTAGTFKLRVNGYETAAITFSATEATLITSVNAALDALDNLAAGELVLSGASIANMTLTSDVEKFYVILVDGDALTGNVTDQPNVTTDITDQGSTLYRLSSQISKFSYEESLDTVDVTAISEFEKTEIGVSTDMTFDMSVYEANEDWKHAVYANASGHLFVYPKGKVAGREYFVFRALFDKTSVDFPDHEVVEAEMSGMRQGAMIVPFHSIYAG